MRISDNNNKALFLGIDGGGSKCKAIVMNDKDDMLGTGISGPANPLHGFEQAINSITESAIFALKNAGLAHVKLSELNAGVGLAGVNLPKLFAQMQAWSHPFKQLFLTTDLRVACLGAHQGQDGAVIISGTGSCGYSYVDGHEFIVGGHGFPQGDKGSGAWFGLQAIEQVLLSLDGLSQPSMLSELLLAKLNCKNSTALVEAIAGKPASDYAQLANLVFDAAELGDQVAVAIIAEGTQYLSRIADILWAKKCPRLSMIGGLTTRLTPWLNKTLQAQLSQPLHAPEVGAVLFARQALATP